MSAFSSAPGRQERRFAAYLDSLAQATEHADRVEPFKSYCTGLLLPGERKSVEPMAARLAPDNVRQTHQSLHHLVAHAPWSDEAVLQQVRQSVLPQMEQNGPVIAWIVDDTGFLKKGTHSVGVARQYCGQIGKQDNCQIAVSLSIATEHASLPIAWRLYLPETWAEDEERRKAGWSSERDSVSNQAGDRPRTDSESSRGWSSDGTRISRCCLWRQLPFSRRPDGAGLTVRGRRSGTYDCLGTGRISAARQNNRKGGGAPARDSVETDNINLFP